MLTQIANTLDQLDLALEYISEGDVNDLRFGLVLTGNAIELTAHYFAKDRSLWEKSDAR